MSDKPELPLTFSRQNSRGLIEVCDAHTGRVLCVQSSHEDLLAQKIDRLTKIETPSGPVWIEKGINFDIINHIKQVPYSKVLADLLCQHVVEGKSLVKACEALNLAYADVIRWRREQNEFKEALNQAEKDRADYLHDEVLDTARQKADTKTEIAALQWAAELGNPEKFGKRTKIVGDKDQPVTFVIGTGITRDLNPKIEGSEQEKLPEPENNVIEIKKEAGEPVVKD